MSIQRGNCRLSGVGRLLIENVAKVSDVGSCLLDSGIVENKPLEGFPNALGKWRFYFTKIITD